MMMGEEVESGILLKLLEGWQPRLIQLGGRLLTAALIIAVGFRIARVVRKMAARSFARIDMELGLRKFLLALLLFLL